jgi:hypothetical protein
MATPRTARRAALVLAGALGLALAPAPAGAEEPTTAADAAALVAARGHELEVLTEEFNEARETLAGQQAAAQAAAAAVTEAQTAVTAAQDSLVGVARSAFTGDTMGSFQALMTSDSADEFVNRVTLLQAVAGHQGELLETAVVAGEAAAQAQIVADRAAAEAQTQYDAVARQQADLQAQIAEYQADYTRLSAEERRAALEAAAAAHGAGEDGRASRTEREEPAAASSAPVAVSGRRPRTGPARQALRVGGVGAGLVRLLGPGAVRLPGGRDQPAALQPHAVADGHPGVPRRGPRRRPRRLLQPGQPHRHLPGQRADGARADVR